MTHASSSVLRTIRGQLALKQWEIASWMKISRVAVTREENGTRPLSSAALTKLLPLAILLPAPVGQHPAIEPLPAASETTDNALAPVRRRLRECEHGVLMTRYTLDDLRTRAQALRRRLEVFPKVRAALEAAPPTATHTRDLDWLDWMMQDAHHGLIECGIASQALLEARAVAFEAEAAALRAVLPSPTAEQ